MMKKFPYADKDIHPNVLEKILRRWEWTILASGDRFSFVSACSLWELCSKGHPVVREGEVELELLVDIQDLSHSLSRAISSLGNLTYSSSCQHRLSYALMATYQKFFVTPCRSFPRSNSASVRSLRRRYGRFRSISSRLGGIWIDVSEGGFFEQLSNYRFG